MPCRALGDRGCVLKGELLDPFFQGFERRRTIEQRLKVLHSQFPPHRLLSSSFTYTPADKPDLSLTQAVWLALVLVPLLLPILPSPHLARQHPPLPSSGKQRSENPRQAVNLMGACRVCACRTCQGHSSSRWRESPR
jgi:hypothetical protein